MKTKNNNVSVIIAVLMTVLLITVCGLFYSNHRSVLDTQAKNNEKISQLTDRLKKLQNASSQKSSSNVSEVDALKQTNSSLSSATEQLQIELAALQTAAQVGIDKSVSRLEERSTYQVPVQNKYVYLTFDDCPSKNTAALLDVLQKNNIKATFFVVYYNDQELYKRIVAEGHTLAIHTYTHDYKTIYASEQAYFDDLGKISDYVKSITGITSKIVRFPGGSSNLVSRPINPGIMTRIAAELDRRGYTYYDWNAQSMDATIPNITPAQVLQNVKSFTEVNGKVKPFVMLLLHNSATQAATVQALQSINHCRINKTNRRKPDEKEKQGSSKGRNRPNHR